MKYVNEWCDDVQSRNDYKSEEKQKGSERVEFINLFCCFTFQFKMKLTIVTNLWIRNLRQCNIQEILEIPPPKWFQHVISEFKICCYLQIKYQIIVFSDKQLFDLTPLAIICT